MDPQTQQPSTEPTLVPPSLTPPQQPDDTVFQTFMPTKNMPSLISYYAGIFGLIPYLGLPASIAAVVLGFMALSQYKKTPTPGAKAHAITGIILGFVELGIFTVFTAIIIISATGNK